MFPQVERPHQPRKREFRSLLTRYRSIGHFYEHVKKGRVAPDCITLLPLLTIGLRTFIGIEALSDEASEAGPHSLFRHNHDKQFGDKEIFMGSGQVTVTDRASGLAALEKIVVQGEGAHPDDPNSHYNIFQHFLKEHETWKHYDYLEDPKTAKYESTPLVYKVRLTTYYTVLQCSYLRTALSRL